MCKSEEEKLKDARMRESGLLLVRKIDEKINNAIDVAAFMLSNIMCCHNERRRFLTDVSLSIAFSIIKLYDKSVGDYVPETEWGKDWIRRTGIMSDSKVSNMAIEAYFDELERLKQIPVSALYRNRPDLPQIEEHRKWVREQVDRMTNKTCDTEEPI